MTNQNASENPGVHIPPPLIVAAMIGSGLLLDRWLGTSPIPYTHFARYVGYGLVGISGFLVIWAMLSYHRHKTNILPHAPDQNLIVDGPFRISRNPIYLAMLGAHMGIGLYLGRPWAILTVILSYLALRFYVIAREERYLERVFGKPYLDFKTTVRRWI